MTIPISEEAGLVNLNGHGYYSSQVLFLVTDISYNGRNHDNANVWSALAVMPRAIGFILKLLSKAKGITLRGQECFRLNLARKPLQQ